MDNTPRRTPATQVRALVERIRHAPSSAQLVAIRDEVMHLPVGDLDAEMLQRGIASRERLLRGPSSPAPQAAPATRGVVPVETTSVRKFMLSHGARIRPAVSRLPRRVEPQRKTEVLATAGI